MIKQWLLAYKICKHLSIKFRPVLSTKQIGTYSKYPCGKEVIEVSLFHKYFVEVFFHELGHKMDWDRNPPVPFHRAFLGLYVRNKRQSLLGTSVDGFILNGEPIKEMLTQEFTASRTAIKLLKKFGYYKKESKVELSRAYYSYLFGLKGTAMADACYIGWKQINK